MIELSASEASRSFSAVLDEAENGETIAVTRNGKRVALIVPAPHANGVAVCAVFHRWAGKLDVDDRFEENVTKVRETASAELDSDPWRD
ncbi:type II toxin-antitoxin system Phd/YefM family antitoxin [Amycolatopsis sp. FBCC-B4732]|uniref:Antitoxin n=1 Tax=Amycolatopsis orientalis subsp. vinearia TaxID=797057 RepID=A0A023GXM5_AMYOR|nr:type II toxin-antitoxin system Phd/YefM family antitoxin [Amycolatopsis sp. FBCC-B4732]AFO69357.1 prevent-host-death family protein [Amycolatopsis orientalis subsp. vinearia]UOX88048.1 type II toxin-antitoxin system Phd/YefM family antitoxin [Amycolatopsis sp. FBCC-B4732]